MNRPTQKQMYYQASRRQADVNHVFLDLVEDGMTRQELQRNIERRPDLWERYRSWLDHLPSA